MMDEFWDYDDFSLAGCARPARKALQFIASHGGATSRWQSVIISMDMFTVCHEVLDFLRSSLLPELQHLELNLHGPDDSDQNDEDAFEDALLLDSLPLFDRPPSKLRTINAKRLPNRFLFGHPNQLHLPSLTRLELDFAADPPAPSELSALLRVTIQLAVLRFCLDGSDLGDPFELEPQHPKVHLRHLREFGLSWVREANWPLSVVMMLDAPHVEILEIDLSQCRRGSDKLLEYLTHGGNELAPQSPFPSVTCLNLEAGPRTGLLQSFLGAQPRINYLEIPPCLLEVLSVEPWLVPGLKHLRVVRYDANDSDIRKLVVARARARLPLEIIDTPVPIYNWTQSVKQKHLGVEREFRFYDLAVVT
ncbi:hypothetical protein FRC08_008607 [Ceratobasidium sp. 394]|nr:hypothetical protein FRC08_008607 [Ceratobasidium sp. 394]